MFGFLDMLKQRKREEIASTDLPSENDGDADDSLPIADQGGFQVTLRRKRRTAMMKKILGDAGYQDLARNISIKED